MTTVSDFSVGDSVSFPAIGRRYSGSFVGTVEKVGTKNLTVRYTKGGGDHLFIATLDPTTVDVEKVGASRPDRAAVDAEVEAYLDEMETRASRRIGF